MQDEANPSLLALLPMPFPSKKGKSKEASWIKINGGPCVLGMNDSEEDNVTDKKAALFGWDNEKPARTVNVPSFEIQHRPVTVEEYFSFLDAVEWKSELIPASWVKQNNEWHVRSVYGPLTMTHCANWPANVSHLQADAYAKHFGYSLVSEEQYSLIRSSSTDINDLNHSFSHFCPTEVNFESKVVTDIAGNGWEWTSTVFEGYEGFKPSSMYPGYSADFFDGLHYVCLGGSWATVSRIVSRPTFRNWYQSKYLFIFSKFRCVKLQ